jgi:hypothetical protein
MLYSTGDPGLFQILMGENIILGLYKTYLRELYMKNLFFVGKRITGSD